MDLRIFLKLISFSETFFKGWSHLWCLVWGCLGTPGFFFFFLVSCVLILCVVPVWSQLHWVAVTRWTPVWDCPQWEPLWGWGSDDALAGSDHSSAERARTPQRGSLVCGPGKMWAAGLHCSAAARFDRKQQRVLETSEGKKIFAK